MKRLSVYAALSKARVRSGLERLRKDDVVTFDFVDLGVRSARVLRGTHPLLIGRLQALSEKVCPEDRDKRYVAQLEAALMSTVEVAMTLSEMRDPYTAGHARRVAQIAAAIGAELGLDERRLEGLKVAGYLHDIGKITIPLEILSKSDNLTEIELQLFKGHSRASFDVLKRVEFPWPVAQVALQHHERMDGSGFPQGLKGEAILLEARIVGVADMVDEVSSNRPYRPGLGIGDALSEIERGSGTVYDPDVANACLRLFRKTNFGLSA